MIGFICDSVVDLPEELARRDDVFVVPVMVILDGKSYRDCQEIEKKTILQHLEKNFAQTSLPNPTDVLESYRSMVERGYNELLVINLSGSLSGTHNLFVTMAAQFMSENPNVHIECIDSLSLSGGAAMLVYRAFMMKERGDSLKVIASDLRKRAGKDNIVFFVLPTLKYLKESGRIGKLEAALGQILNVKPIVTIDRSGVFSQVGRTRGMRKAVEKMVEKLKSAVNGKKIFCIALYHSGDDDETMTLVSWVKEQISGLSKVLFAGELSAGILVHGGSGIIGIGALVG